MSSALATRHSDTRTVVDRNSLSYAEYQTRPREYYSNPHSDIAIPADQLVAMVDRLMLRVQAAVRPTVTWSLYDCWLYRSITMRWGNGHSQLQLDALIGTDRGFSLSLYPFWFNRHDATSIVANLATWMLYRSDWSWDYGDLQVVRLSKWGWSHDNTEHVQLQFNDPVLNGIPRKYRPVYYGEPRPELGDDIIAVTGAWLDAAGIR